MERKEVMGGKRPSPDDELSVLTDAAAKAPAPQTREDGRISSASDFFERLNQIPVNHARHEAQRELTSSEFLEFLRKQGPGGQFRSVAADGNFQGSSNKSQSMHNKDKNQYNQSVAIDQCDITSSVDYGSRDYYRPSTHTSDTPYIPKENELDELYKTCTDTRGNWWQGSFYY